LLHQSYLEGKYDVFDEGLLVVYLLSFVLGEALWSSLADVYLEVLDQELYHLKVALIHGKMERVPHHAVFYIVPHWVKRLSRQLELMDFLHVV